ncbi:MAG: 2OG-Fe(II) oxygenase [Rhodospirillales bacterium]
MIFPFDDVMSEEKNKELYEFLLRDNTYRYGERDRAHLVPVGLSLEIDDTEMFNFLGDIAKSNFGRLKDLELQRAYVNLFLPNDRPFFHQDGDVYTCLFYVTPQYDIDEGGETQFIVNNLIQGLPPRPGRLVVFDGELWHRATSYRSHPRLTVALKFIKNETASA